MTTAASVRSLPGAGLRARLGVNLPWLALAPLLLIPIVGSSAGALNALLFVTELLLLAAGVQRPVWIVAALLMSEMTASNYLFGSAQGFDISARLVLSLISLPILVPHIASRIDVGPHAKLTIAIGFAFIFLTTFVDLLYADEAFTIQFLRYIIIGLYLLILIPATIRNRDDLRDLGVFVLGLAAISAVVGILQHLHSAHGTPLWQVIPNPGSPGDTFESWEERLIGLSEDPIHAGNVMMIPGLFALGAILVAPFKASTKRIVALTLLVLTLAAYFTYTRSLAIAMVPALLTMALLYKGKYKKEFWLIIIVLAGGVWYWSDMRDTRYTLTASNDDSAAARPVLWTLGLDIAYDHPWLGVGHDAFLQLSPEYAKDVSTSLLDRENAKDVVGKYAPHNDLINVWLSWGFFALVLYIVFTILIGKNFYDTFAQARDPLLRGLALGGLAAVLGYTVNSQFHNLLDSTLSLWILGGFSLVLLKLASQEPAEEEDDDEPPPADDEPIEQKLFERHSEDKWESCAV